MSTGAWPSDMRKTSSLTCQAGSCKLSTGAWSSGSRKAPSLQEASSCPDKAAPNCPGAVVTRAPFCSPAGCSPQPAQPVRGGPRNVSIPCSRGPSDDLRTVRTAQRMRCALVLMCCLQCCFRHALHLFFQRAPRRVRWAPCYET